MVTVILAVVYVALRGGGAGGGTRVGWWMQVSNTIKRPGKKRGACSCRPLLYFFNYD
jgi:hypothetical protein